MRVLIVDSDAKMRTTLTRLLRLRGVSVSHATSNEDALARVEEEHFDVTLIGWLDYRDDDCNGLSLTRAIRRRGFAVPVILYSMWAGREDRVRALDAGADDVFIDPINGSSELFARAYALYRRASGSVVARLRIGRIEIDVAARLVTIGGVKTQMTAIEFRLISLLAAHSPNIVTKEELFSTLGYRHDGRHEALKQAMMRLRRRLGPASDQLRSIRGVGYRLAGEVGLTSCSNSRLA